LADIRSAVETGNLGAVALQGRLSHEWTDIEKCIAAYSDLLGSTRAELESAAGDVRQLIEAGLIMAEAERLKRKRSGK
jgi:hypothetical protein